ncbi:GIN domain-containing protein [Reyranella sp. CPCC 100927]|uniref:GIN domain-containing protein n=1 Tax=Reyranella sp. CPCC 100927 TaxID=2599616 RepID=UPI0011B35EA3|nr:DUF2807 domain-containing protein [Reyranella sp. CPCC 100927]TWT09658.1 DUF2807 domain-containing protein [Reyranella sp. CPCC 100927]
MNRRLAWTAAIGLATSAVSLIAAAWIASAAPSRVAGCWRMPLARTLGFEPLPPDIHSGQPGTITLPWNGGEAITINLPAAVTYQSGAKAEAIISGDSALIRHVRLQDGKLAWDGALDTVCLPSEHIVVQLTGPPVTNWLLHGSARLVLSAIDQDTLHLRIRGSGNVNASGRAQLVSLDVAGSGNADLSKLAVRRATVTIHGSGDAAIAPRDEADIRIAGSGSITLHGEPGKLQTHISGSGKVRRAP